jgi:hypothetical protein
MIKSDGIWQIPTFSLAEKLGYILKLHIYNVFSM